MPNTHSLDLELSSSQHAKVADNADVSPTGDVSIEAWLKLETLASTIGVNPVIAGKYEVTDLSYVFVINQATDELRFLASDDGSTDSGHFVGFNSVTTMSDTGVWVHVSCAFDISAETCKFCINGVEENGVKGGGQSIGANIHDSNQNFAIGAIFTGGTPQNFYDGKIDDVRLWDDLRTEAEISDNKDSELDGNEDNLVGYWKLNDNYTDSCKSSDLTAVGSPVFSTDIPFDVSETITVDKWHKPHAVPRLLIPTAMPY